MPKRATAEDVAQAAGVSRATVSRAFTPSTYVAKETRTKIFEAADALGYRRNALARALIKQESDLVAIVTGRMNNMFDAQVFDELTRELQANRKWGLLVHADDDDVARLIDEALGYPVEAVIVRSGSVDSKTIEQCARLGVPLILTGMEEPEFDADSVCCDNMAGVHMAVGALVERGAQRIAYIGGPPHLYSESSRFDGFRTALDRFGLEPAAILRGDFTFDSGLSIGNDLLSGPVRPDGIFCCNDAMAIGVLNAARETHRLQVPQDVAVVGFDDIPMSGWPCFELTTVRNAPQPTATAVLDVLKRRLAEPELPPMAVRIEPELIRRRTA